MRENLRKNNTGDNRLLRVLNKPNNLSSYCVLSWCKAGDLSFRHGKVEYQKRISIIKTKFVENACKGKESIWMTILRKGYRMKCIKLEQLLVFRFLAKRII